MRLNFYMKSLQNVEVYVQTLQNLVDIMDVVAAKTKVITEFSIVLKELQRGYKPEYDHILNLINLIDIYQEIPANNRIYEHLMYHV